MVIVVKECFKCPFCNTLENGTLLCNASMPSKREIPDGGKTIPSFCPLKREQVIVRSFEG